MFWFITELPTSGPTAAATLFSAVWLLVSGGATSRVKKYFRASCDSCHISKYCLTCLDRNHTAVIVDIKMFSTL